MNTKSCWMNPRRPRPRSSSIARASTSGSRSAAGNPSELALTRALSSAEALPAWAAADRRVSDLAPAVPMTNARTVVLVSERAGNVQDHPQWFTLLDQMWVR